MKVQVPDMTPMIQVQNLTKVFTIHKKEKGLRGALKGLFLPEKFQVTAVDNISFDIEAGQIVGYLGPNGAGKSTTVKMMTGILNPTSGTVLIRGLSPQQRRKEVVRKIGVVFGQRTQLYWDLRLGETFELLRRIYRMDQERFDVNFRELDEVLKLKELMNTPVRQLSLGQRMRGDLAAAMLHAPELLFLDEPTIGLDIEAKQAIRGFILQINHRKKTTVILTTHDLDDVEQLCHRLIVINHGKIIEDGPLNALIDRLSPYRILVIDCEKTPQDLSDPDCELIKQENLRYWLRFDRNRITAAELISRLSQKVAIKDLSVKEPAIEDVIRKVYEKKAH